MKTKNDTGRRIVAVMIPLTAVALPSMVIFGIFDTANGVGNVQWANRV